MRRYKVSYFFGQAFRGMWRNGMMTLASVTVLLSCLIVMGCFSMLVVNINFNLGQLKNLNEIVAFADTDKPYAADSAAPLAPAVRADGKTFLGWSTDPDATAAEYQPGSSFRVTGDKAVCGVITVYAVWEGGVTRDGLKIRYSAAGIAVDGKLPDDADAAADESYALTEAPEARSSAIEFVGWALVPDADENTKLYAPGDEYKVSAADAKGGVITFYAIWSTPASFSEYALVYDSNGVDCEMPTDSAVRLDNIKKKLNGLENIAENGIKFVSKEETLESEKEKLKDYPSLLATIEEGENPYPDSFVITYKDNASVSALNLQLKNIDGIYKTRCRADIAENIQNLKNGIILIFTWFMAILFIVSIFVIINTVKLAVVGRSKEITIMRYVGATKWFIALPFELEGIIIGLFSGLAAFFLQWYMYGYVQKMVMTDIQMIKVMPFGDIRIILLAGCVVIGALTGFIGSRIAIRKYLKA